MRLKIVFSKILLIVFISIFAFTFFSCRTKTNDKKNNGKIENRFKIPVYKNAFNIKPIDESGMTKGMTYQVKINYPASDLVRFYENEMSYRGYKANRNLDLHGCDGEWSYFVDGTIKNEPSVASINLCWTKGEKTVLLLLKYFYFENDTTSIVLESLYDLEVACYLLDY